MKKETLSFSVQTSRQLDSLILKALSQILFNINFLVNWSDHFPIFPSSLSLPILLLLSFSGFMLFPLSALCTQTCFHHSLLPSPFPFVSPWLWTQRSPLPWGPVYLSHFPLFDIQLLRDRRRKGKNKFSNSLLRGRSLSKTLTVFCQKL